VRANHKLCAKHRVYPPTVQRLDILASDATVIAKQPTGRFEQWFHERGIAPRAWQVEVSRAFRARESGMICAPAGSGKTLAVIVAMMAEAVDRPADPRRTQLLAIVADNAACDRMRATLSAFIEECALPWTVEARTGSNGLAARARVRRPTAVIATVEEAEQLLTWSESAKQFRSLTALLIDDWHLIAAARTSTQLALIVNRLRAWKTELRIWATSTPLRDGETAMRMIPCGQNARLIAVERARFPLRAATVSNEERFPWPEHLAMKLDRQAAPATVPGLPSQLSHVRALLDQLSDTDAPITIAPSDAWQALEIAALKRVVAQGMPIAAMESTPLDVLIRHLLCCGAGGGFTPDELRSQVEAASAFRQMSVAQWHAALSLAVQRGGLSEQSGRFAVTGRQNVRALRSRLVAPSPKQEVIDHALEAALADEVRELLAATDSGSQWEEELAALAPLVAVQRSWSRLPRRGELLIEMTELDSGFHCALFPCAGRAVNDGIAALLRLRLARSLGRPMVVVSNRFGVGISSDMPLPSDEQTWRTLLAADGAAGDIASGEESAAQIAQCALNLARRACLDDDEPSADRSDEFFAEAQRAWLRDRFDSDRLMSFLNAAAESPIALVDTPRLTPLAFPLWAEAIRTVGPADTWSERVHLAALQHELRAEHDDR
jgi:Lhr-like helicase